MVRWLRWHCPPDTGFEIRALAVWGRARYLSVTEAPHNTNFHTWMGKKQFCFFQTAETGNRTPDSGVKGSGANHYPRAPALGKTGCSTQITSVQKKWNESGFRPPLCTYRLNWARRTSWGWWDDWDGTVLQTQDSKFEPWRSEAEHATSRSRRLPTILTFTRGWGRNNFVSFKPPRPGTEPRTLAWKAAVLTTTLGPPPWAKQGVLLKLPLCKTVQFQCTYFYRTARLWNTLPFVIRDASSLQILKKNLIELNCELTWCE